MQARLTALVEVSFADFTTPAQGIAPAMRRSLKILGSSLVLLALFLAGFSDAHAIIIDTFEDGDQQVCSACGGLPISSEVPTSSGIGGWRFMQATGVPARVEGIIAVDASGPVLFSSPLPPVPVTDGSLTTIWDGEGDTGLGGIDLTAGGDAFNVQVLDTGSFEGAFNNLILRVTDTNGNEDGFSRTWENLNDGVGPPGMNLFEFSSLGGVDLTSVDAITLELTHSFPEASIIISEIRVVPEPGTALLMGLGLAGLAVVGRPRRS